MAWACPACSTVLRGNELDSKPQVGERYRCYVCRLSLDFDPDLDRFVVAPFETDHATTTSSPPARPRTFPQPITPGTKLSRKRRRG